MERTDEVFPAAANNDSVPVETPPAAAPATPPASFSASSPEEWPTLTAHGRAPLLADLARVASRGSEAKNSRSAALTGHMRLVEGAAAAEVSALPLGGAVRPRPARGTSATAAAAALAAAGAQASAATDDPFAVETAAALADYVPVVVSNPNFLRSLSFALHGTAAHAKWYETWLRRRFGLLSALDHTLVPASGEDVPSGPRATGKSKVGFATLIPQLTALWSHELRVVVVVAGSAAGDDRATQDTVLLFQHKRATKPLEGAPAIVLRVDSGGERWTPLVRMHRCPTPAADSLVPPLAHLPGTGASATGVVVPPLALDERRTSAVGTALASPVYSVGSDSSNDDDVNVETAWSPTAGVGGGGVARPFCAWPRFRNYGADRGAATPRGSLAIGAVPGGGRPARSRALAPPRSRMGDDDDKALETLREEQPFAGMAYPSVFGGDIRLGEICRVGFHPFLRRNAVHFAGSLVCAIAALALFAAMLSTARASVETCCALLPTPGRVASVVAPVDPLWGLCSNARLPSPPRTPPPTPTTPATPPTPTATNSTVATPSPFAVCAPVCSRLRGSDGTDAHLWGGIEQIGVLCSLGLASAGWCVALSALVFFFHVRSLAQGAKSARCWRLLWAAQVLGALALAGVAATIIALPLSARVRTVPCDAFRGAPLRQYCRAVGAADCGLAVDGSFDRYSEMWLVAVVTAGLAALHAAFVAVPPAPAQADADTVAPCAPDTAVFRASAFAPDGAGPRERAVLTEAIRTKWRREAQQQLHAPPGAIVGLDAAAGGRRPSTAAFLHDIRVDEGGSPGVSPRAPQGRVFGHGAAAVQAAAEAAGRRGGAALHYEREASVEGGSSSADDVDSAGGDADGDGSTQRSHTPPARGLGGGDAPTAVAGPHDAGRSASATNGGRRHRRSPSRVARVGGGIGHKPPPSMMRTIDAIAARVRGRVVLPVAPPASVSPPPLAGLAPALRHEGREGRPSGAVVVVPPPMPWAINAEPAASKAVLGADFAGLRLPSRKEEILNSIVTSVAERNAGCNPPPPPTRPEGAIGKRHS